jgi:hypothetical protein
VWYLHPIRDDSDRSRLRRTATNDIVHETDEARDAFKELFPDGAVVVANDGGGSYLLLLPGGGRATVVGAAHRRPGTGAHRLVAGVRRRGAARSVAATLERRGST